MFWPVAVVVSLEILARVDWPDGLRWTLLRFGGLAPVGLVAAVVSYRHLSGLLAWYGEDVVTATLGPLAVDGLMVLASGALLVEPSTRRAARRKPATAPAPVVAQPVTPTPDRPRATSTRPALGAPADLHVVGRQVAAELAAQAVPLTRKALVSGLRERGIPVGTDKATQLLAALKAA
jgi:hypothetical protein